MYIYVNTYIHIYIHMYIYIYVKKYVYNIYIYPSEKSTFFPRASERRVLPIVGVCKTSSHLHIFSSSHLLILTSFPHPSSSHLHIFSSSHLLIFTPSHLHIFSSSHLLIFTSSHPHIFSSSSHLHIFSSPHLLIFTSSHLHIFSSSHLLTSSHLHIFSHLLTSSHIFSHLLTPPLTSSHIFSHLLTSSHLLIFSSSHLLIFTSSHPHIFSSSSHLHIFSSPHLLLIFTSSHLHIFSHLLTSSHTSTHIFSHLHSHLLTSSHIFSHLLTSSHIFSHLLIFTSSHLTSSPLALLPSPSFLFLFWRREQGQCQRDGTKRNPFARNEGRSSKTEVKLWFYLCRSNPFARNEGRSSKTEVKLWFYLCRSNPFARNEGRSSKTEVKLWFYLCRSNPFARNEGRSSKTEVKLWFYLCRSNPFARNEGRSSKTEVKSADPGLCQGRGGAWDHRRCGTWLSGRKQRHTPSRQHLCQLHAPAIYMLLPNSYTYMPLPSVFQEVQDCRLPGLKPSKRFRRPPRQQLLQLLHAQQLLQLLHAPAICFSGGSRLPFARPQTPQTLPTLPQASKATTLTATCPCHLFFRGFKTAVCPPQTPQTLPTLPQASKATTLTATTCPCHLFFRGFKTAVCPASNPPNASNPSAGLQGNNSYSYMPLPSVFQGVQDCRLPALKPPKPFRRPPRQQLLQLHAPAICFSGGSRLPFARPQTPQTLPQASKATTLKATCPCHLFSGGSRLPFARLKPPKPFRRPPRQQLLQLHAPAICFSGGSRLPFARPQTPPNASNPSAGLQGNNSYSYMPLPSVFQGVQDCCLPALKPPKRFQPSRRPPRQQLLQLLHAPAICFSGGSRLPFARPQTPQTLPTLPQASKATTLTATCPCHLFFRGFKTAVCPPSNPPNPSAGLQGNNSYSYMSLPSVFQGVQDCRLPGLKPPKRFQPFRRPPRQQLLQLHAPAICFSGGSRLPFARPQTPQTLPQASKATTLTATCPCHLFFRGFKTAVCPPSNPPNPSAGLQPPTCPCHLFFRGFKTAVCPPQTPQTLPTLPQASKATTLTATRPCHLFFRGFKTAVCPPSNPPNASNPSAGLQGNNSYSYMPLPSVFQGVQDRPSRQQLLQLHAPAICFSGGSRLPFARPQTPQTLPQASKATTLTATCPCHLFFRGFKTAVCPPSNPPNPSASLQGNNSYSYMPLPSVFQGVQDCRLPGLKPSKRFRRPPRQQLLQLLHAQQLLQLHAPAICFSGSSRLPFARPQTPQTLPTLPQASKATTLTATCPCHLFFRGFKTAVCPPQTPQTLPTLPQASKATTLTATCPCHLFFRGFKTAVCPPSNPPNASNPSAGLQGNNSYSYMPLPSVFQGVQDRPSRQQLLQLHAPAICFSGGSRLPFARPQTPQTLPQASKATTLTATCPCHLFFRGFKTAVCPPSNPPNPSASLQGNNSYSYMPLPSVFQRVQDCRLPALKPPKPFRRPPRQQLLQLHAPAICFSGGSRLPFARPQTPQTLPQASKATTLTATCPCHLFFKGFKTAVCPPSNPPNPSAGLQGNNSYSYMPLPSVFQGVQDCRLPALKPPKPFRRPPRQQLLQLHAPAICFSGGSRLPFARPQTPQTLPTLPQASKATTLTATCPCHLFFRGFKTAVCPPSNPPNASNPPAGLQGNNSFSYMPLPSVFQGVQDCRLPGLKPPKRFQPSRRPPRQQLLQLLHAPAICFSRGSRLPFARPQTPQTLPQASKATTLTATCPCHLFFRGFKTAVCPPSNPPNPSNPPAGLQGNNSYSYMSLPSVFQGVQDCRLPGLKPPKRFQPFRRPPRQQLLQLHAPAICFSGGSRLPFARPQTPQTLPQASKATTLTAQLHAPAICFSGGSRLPFARPQTPQTLPQASKATTLTATCPCHLFFRGFKTAVCPASNPPNASNPSAGLQGNNSYSYMPLPSVFQGVQDCRLPALKPPKPFRRPPRQQLLQLHAPAICFSGGSRLPFARPQTPQTLPTLPQASKATTLTATCPCHLFFRGFKTAVCPPSNPNASNPSAGLQGNNSYSYMPLPSVFQGVQDCRLPALKPPKPFRRPPRQQLLQLHAPAICFSGGSRLPFARPQTPQTLPTLPQASKATTLTATCPCHLFFRGFKTAVCPPSNPPNASNPSAGLQGNNSYSYMPLPSVFQGVQDCRLPALKPPKPFRRPPRQQLLQLHAPAICFSGGSRLPFARPQTPQTLPTLPQASKATTLTATCPCHLFFRGFKTAVCPPSNPPNASNPPAGLQGNNSYSYYMPLPSVFQGVQDCRLPALKPPKRFQPFRRPPRQQLLQLHAPAICFSGGSRLPLLALKPPKRFQPFRRPPRQQLLQLHVPAICFSGGSRLPFARPQIPQTLPTLPQASKATTLTATCPCHLFFRRFKTAVCPASNPPNASAGLQGNNSYSYMTLPSVFQGVQDCRLPGLKPPKRFQPFRRPPRQQLLQLHAPAICFSGGSRLPFARPQTLQTLPQASKATTLTATWPCHLFFRGFKTAVCPASNPPNASAGLQGNNCYSYMPLPSVFQGVHGLQEPVIHRLLWGFCCGTNHFVFLHGFPAGVSWLTWICPNERHDHTTVWHTGHEWAWRRVFLLTWPSFT